jgi:hypothetical protein
MDIGLLVIVAAAIGGFAWWMFRRKGAATSAEPDSLDLFGRAAEGGPASGPAASVRLRGPKEDRLVRVAVPCIIGRSGDAHLSVDDDLVSRRHAILEYRGDRLWIVDLASRNGTFVDGAPAGDGAPLMPGSTVTVGSTELGIAPE